MARKSYGNPKSLQEGLKEKRRPQIDTLKRLFAPGLRGKKAGEMIHQAIGIKWGTLSGCGCGGQNMSEEAVERMTRAVRAEGEQHPGDPVIQELVANFDGSVFLTPGPEELARARQLDERNAGQARKRPGRRPRSETAGSNGHATSGALALATPAQTRAQAIMRIGEAQIPVDGDDVVAAGKGFLVAASRGREVHVHRARSGEVTIKISPEGD